MVSPGTGCLVHLRDNQYIDVSWNGRITKAMAAQCNQDILKAASHLQSLGKPVHLRVRILNPPVLPNVDAFTEATKTLSAGIPFERIVIWGPVPFPVKKLIGILIYNFSADHTIKYIQDEPAALHWLLQGPSSVL
jgi:hypothetical protein